MHGYRGHWSYECNSPSGYLAKPAGAFGASPYGHYQCSKKRTPPNQVQVWYRVESEQSDLSKDENSVLEVQCEQKGEWDANI